MKPLRSLEIGLGEGFRGDFKNRDTHFVYQNLVFVIVATTSLCVGSLSLMIRHPMSNVAAGGTTGMAGV